MRRGAASRAERPDAAAVVASALLALACATPASAQIPTVVHGRVEDAATRGAVSEATVFAADSSAVAYTDSTGAFVLPVPPGTPLTVHVERLGYLAQRFDLDPSAPRRVSVLLLEPAPIEIEGVTVVDEQAIDVLVRTMASRRNAYPHAMMAMDRTWLDRFTPVGSVYDVVRMRLPRLQPCRSDRDRLCLPGRIRTISNPYPQVPFTVCVDGWVSLQPMIELNTLPVESVALIEIFHGGTPHQIRVYTQSYMLRAARIGRTWALPLVTGC